MGALLLAPGGVARSGGAKYQVPDGSLVGQIEHLRATTWRWERVMSRPLTAGSTSYRTDQSRRYRRWGRGLWRGGGPPARGRGGPPPLPRGRARRPPLQACWAPPVAP